MGDIIKKEPLIRFDSFSDAWEQRKAKDLAEYLKGNGYSKSDLVEEGTPIILYGRLYTNYQFFIDNVGTFSKVKSGSVFSKGNEVIIPASGETSEDIARASAVLLSGVLLGGDLNVLRPFDCLNPLFLALTISNGNTQKELAKKAQGKSVVHIRNSDIQELTISYPSTQEQNCIIGVFRTIDNLITLHQRKLENLKNVKKCLLRKMFPKDGKIIPDLRFASFADAWEQCKLNKISTINPKTQLPERFEYVDLESVCGTEMIASRQEKRDSAPSRAQRFAEFGDLFYQTVRPYQRNNLLFEKTSNNYVFSTGYAQLRPAGDSYFLLSLVQTEPFVKNVLDRCTGTSYPAIGSGDLADIDVKIPTNLSEQINIGKIFRCVDNLITLHQSKHDKLINMKKSLLGKMFL